MKFSNHHVLTIVLACYNVRLVLAQAPTAAPVLNPPCAICGCSFCPPGFLVGNPTAVIPIPPEFLGQAPPGLTQVPCSLLDFAGTSGQIPPDLCNDDLRLLPEFRSICGCPPLPARPTTAPVMAPRAVPVAPPTNATVPVAPPRAAPTAPVPAPTAPVVAPAAPVPAPVVAPTAPMAPPMVAPTMPVAVPVAFPTKPYGGSADHYIDEVYNLTHPVSSSYSVRFTGNTLNTNKKTKQSNSTFGSSWATVADVMDRVGKAGFLHEHCARTSTTYWYCTGTFVDLYYESYKRGRCQYHGQVSFSGWFSDTSKDGYFTITGGTDDFRSAKGHIFVTHEGTISRREIHAWY